MANWPIHHNLEGKSLSRLVLLGLEGKIYKFAEKYKFCVVYTQDVFPFL